MTIPINSNSAYYIGFDFGMRRIGVAVGQKFTKTATPLPKISAKNGAPNWEAVKSLVSKWRPTALIVGVPVNIDGTSQAITIAAKNFIEQLKIHTGLSVFEAEERLTTKAAREKIFGEGGYKALQETSIDSFAAKIILEEWMDNL